MAQQGDPFPFFHLFSSDYSLDDLPSLTSAQLAAAWVIHPDYDESAHGRKIAKIWRSRREKGRHLIGNANLGVFATAEQRAEDPCFGFELIDLGSWDIPADLSTLTSAQLAALPFHPQFQADKHAEAAEDLFYKRRDRAGGVSMTDAIEGKANLPSSDVTASTATDLTVASASAPSASVPDVVKPVNLEEGLAASDSSNGNQVAPIQNADSAESSGQNAASDSPGQPGQSQQAPSKVEEGKTEPAQTSNDKGMSEPAKTKDPSLQPVAKVANVDAPSQQVEVVEEDDPLLPEGLVEEWSILHLNGIARDMPEPVVWSLLSPPHLPPPIAVKLRPARPAPGYLESNFHLCFAAYKNDEDADLAQRGLNGATFGKNTVKAERSVSKRRAAVWHQSMLSDEYRQYLETVDLSQYPQLTVSIRPTSQAQPQQQASSSNRNQNSKQQQKQSQQRSRSANEQSANSGPPPQKRKRRDRQPTDELPPSLANRLSSVQIYNLPFDVSPADVYRYFPPVIAGCSVSTDPKEVSTRRPAPGRVFVAFEDPEVQRDILATFVSKKQFPNCDRTMWYRTDDEKSGGWHWAEMSEGYKARYAREAPPRGPPTDLAPPPMGNYGPRYDWPPHGPPVDNWGRSYDYPPDYGPPRLGPLAGAMGPPGYYGGGRPDEYGRYDYPRYDDYGPPPPITDQPYPPPPSHQGYRDGKVGSSPVDAYRRQPNLPPPGQQHGNYQAAPVQSDRFAGGPPPSRYGMGDSPASQFGQRSPAGYQQSRYDGPIPLDQHSPMHVNDGSFRQPLPAGPPPIHDNAQLAPGPATAAAPPFDGYANAGGPSVAAPAQQALDSLLATLKRPDASSRKRDWEQSEASQ